jgi:uncharacterized protein YkwD
MLMKNYKKVLNGIFAAVIFFFCYSQTAAASDITVRLNGAEINFDQPPIIQNGRTLVPMRAIFEAMGCHVSWNGEDSSITATASDGTTVHMRIGSSVMTVDGNVMHLDVPPQIVNTRTLVPLRAINEALGAVVGWDAHARRADISTPLQTVPDTRTVPAPQTAPDTQSAPGESYGDFEHEVIRLTNVERAKEGLPALLRCDLLTLAAQGHSMDMAQNNFVNHIGSDGSNPFDRMDKAGAMYGSASENVAAGPPTPADVVKGWMDSPGHRVNILNPRYTHIGIGLQVQEGSPYKYYWTQKFRGA